MSDRESEHDRASERARNLGLISSMLRLTDYSKVDMPGFRYKSVNSRAGKSVISPK